MKLLSNNKKFAFKIILFSVSLIFFAMALAGSFIILDKRKTLYETIREKAYIFSKSSAISLYQMYTDSISLSSLKFFENFKQSFNLLTQSFNIPIVRVAIIGRNGVVLFDSLDLEKADPHNFITKKETITIQDENLLKKINLPTISIEDRYYETNDHLFLNPLFHNQPPQKILNEVLEIVVPKPEVIGEHFVSVCYWFSYDKIREETIRMFLLTTAGFLFTALIVSLFAIFFSKKLIKPILNLHQAIQNITHSNRFNIQIPIESNDEIGELAKAFNQMAKKLHSYFNRMKNLNKELEIKVVNRTRDLIDERNKLKIRNEQIEKDIQIAKKIQQQLIPLSSPSNHIAFFYKTMDQVGGDFYDFVVFQEGEKFGIFLSDVSGHGIPAAFITSMVKSFMLQAGDLRLNPAKLFNYLNEVLIQQTAGNFITAFYGIYDTRHRTLEYCNAGHNYPYIINHNQIEMIKGGFKGFPLAIFNKEELKQRKKEYQNSVLQLRPGSKIFFYTDGVSEAKKLTEDVYFEESNFEQKLLALYPLSSKDFVHQLYQELVSFRGSDSFEDDICMICIQVV